jgi:hypothetical protein
MIAAGAFTEETAGVFALAFGEAQAALAKTGAAQGELDASYGALEAAAGGLALKPAYAQALGELVGMLIELAVRDWTLCPPEDWASMLPVYADAWALVGLIVG